VVKRLLKLLHELAGIGITGALACQLVLIARAPADITLPAYAVLRQSIVAIHSWILLPSLALVLVSGLAAMAVHYPFAQSRWVWAKAITGIGLLEGTLVVVMGTARRAAEQVTEAPAAPETPALMAELMRTEWIGLWTVFVLCLVNVVLGVLRPRLDWPRTRPRAA
jgi:hypothetical protein